MFNNVYLSNTFRYFFLLLIQGLALQYIGYDNIHIFIYPIFLMLLPLELPHGLVIFLAFLMGISIDMFYNTFGLHASVMVILSFARPLICSIMEPRGGYEVGQTLTKYSLGLRWFIRYSTIVTFFHSFFVVILEELSINWFVIARIFISFLFSMLLIILYQFIFNPKQ